MHFLHLRRSRVKNYTNVHTLSLSQTEVENKEKIRGWVYRAPSPTLTRTSGGPPEYRAVRKHSGTKRRASNFRLPPSMATKQNDNDEGDASLFSADLSLIYRPPRSTLRQFLWRWRMCFESTFALSMFEGWEKILIGASPPRLEDDVYSESLTMRVVTLMATFCALLVTGIYRYLPYHLQFLYQRAVYYLSGTEQKDWTSVRGVGVAMLSTKAPHAYTAEL